MSILDGYLAEQLTDALTAADIPQDCVVTTQETVDPGTPWDPSDDTITNVDHACQGWVDDYSTLDRTNTLIQLNDRRVYIVASTLDVTPAPTSTVTINGATLTVIAVSRDPAGTAWVLQCRV